MKKVNFITVDQFQTESDRGSSSMTVFNAPSEKMLIGGKLASILKFSIEFGIQNGWVARWRGGNELP